MAKQLRLGQNLHTKTAQPLLDHIAHCVPSVFSLQHLFHTLFTHPRPVLASTQTLPFSARISLC